jgi:hypothetical protein
MGLAVSSEHAAIEAGQQGDVIEALGALEPVWDELYPTEQARILRLLIERIAEQEAPAPAASEPLLEAAE